MSRWDTSAPTLTAQVIQWRKLGPSVRWGQAEHRHGCHEKCSLSQPGAFPPTDDQHLLAHAVSPQVWLLILGALWEAVLCPGVNSGAG